ncbi:hypothetical protein ACN47E_005325 [Coniothyrium glycines]
MLATQAATSTQALPSAPAEHQLVRLHITPFRPELLKVYLAPSILSLAQNISYHSAETFPEKGFGYVELPEAEAQKLKNKLNGTTLRGSKVRIEMARSEKRKAREEADAAAERAEAERPSKRVRKEKKRKEQGVLDGVELPDERKVKRGWTEPAAKIKKDKRDRKEKHDDKDKHSQREQKPSKYTKEPELLFKAKLTPVAATEVARQDKKKEKREKKEKNKSKAREVVVHEFEKNHKTPTFLKETKVSTTEKKPAVDYVNGLGWVDEDGVVVEPETGRAKARRALELVDKPTEAAKAWIDGSAKPGTSATPASKNTKEKKKVSPPPESSESEDDESSVVSSSSEDESSESDDEESQAESSASSPPHIPEEKKTPEVEQPSASGEKEVHPLEALFKRAKPADVATSTPVKKLTPINTSFSFFDNNDDTMENDAELTENVPTTPFTQRDLEWRGLRSAAPTPDTAAIGRRFSFDWRKGSQEADDDEDMDDLDPDALEQLSHNTKANATKTKAQLPGVTEEEEVEDDEDAAKGATDEKPESEFRKWFWENRGDLNRAWKKRRRDTLKNKRHTENKKMTGSRRLG